MTYCKRHSTPHELRMNEECKVEDCSICGRIEMKEYTITIKVKEKDVITEIDGEDVSFEDWVGSTISSNAMYDGVEIQRMCVEEESK